MEEKRVGKLHPDSREQLANIPESGMGYYIVRGQLDDEGSIFIIAGDFFVVPDEHSEYFSLSDLMEGKSFPSDTDENPPFLGLRNIKPVVSAASVALPHGYVPAFGAIPLIGTITLNYATNFYRFIGSSHDPRFIGGELTQGTYLTTSNDQAYANTGFAAVGRYALPLPVPASNVFIYQLRAQTTLDVGTVLPNYGQAGGGVEVRLKVNCKATQLKHIKLFDY